MNLIDEKNRTRKRFDFLHHRFEAFFEVAAIARAGEQRAHVEREDRCTLQDVGHMAIDDLARQALRDRRLADAGITDEQRIVLLTAAEHLHGAHDFLLAADQRIDLAVAGLLVEVDAIGIERVAGLLLLALGRARILVDAMHRARLEHAGTLGDPMRDVLDGVEPRHLLLLQEKRGVALALRKDADEHICARHFFAPRCLNVDDGPLHDTLERICRMRVARSLRHDRFQFRVEVLDEAGAKLLEIDRAGTHDGGRVAIIDERQQQMFQRREFVVAHIRILHRAVQRSFEIFGERCQSNPTLSPWCTVKGGHAGVKSP